MPEEVRITFTQLVMHDTARSRGSGRFRFTGSIGGVSLGLEPGILGQPCVVDMNAGQGTVDLAPLGWQAVVRPATLRSLDVSVRGVDADNPATTLGSTTHRFSQLLTVASGTILHIPQGSHTDDSIHFSITYTVEPSVAGEFRVQPGDAVFATRANNGGVNFATVSGDVQLARLEICPIRPVPPDANMPPRPVFLPTAAPAVLNGHGVPTITPTDDLNLIPNPAVIPILDPRLTHIRNCARIEYTWYRPSTLNFTADDERLQWSADPPNKVGFLNNRRTGLGVHVYGIGSATAADSEVTFTVRFRGAEFAKYRAIVGNQKFLRYRATIFNGPAGPPAAPMQSRPRHTPALIAQQMHAANVLLHQMCINLVPDSNTTINNARPGGGAPLAITASATPGVYSAVVPDAQTRNAPWSTDWLSVNYRQNILNFIYIKTSTLPNNLGFAFSYPDHPGRTTAGAAWNKTDNGAPSTSWVRPSGVLPDGAAAAVSQRVIPAYYGPPTRFANLVGMAVTDLVDPTAAGGTLTFGATIAHEVGHMLSLGHRVENPAIAPGNYDDLVNHPAFRNVMHWTVSSMSQDLDIIQAKIARASALFT